MVTTTFRFLNLILAALLAGTSFGIWMGFNPVNLSPATYVEQQQHTVHSLNVLMVSLVIIATIITIISAFLQKSNKPVFTGLMVAATFYIACILISALGNKPIQESMLLWDAHSLPSNWKVLRDQWWSFHIMRTISELIALCIITWVSIKKGIDH